MSIPLFPEQIRDGTAASLVAPAGGFEVGRLFPSRRDKRRVARRFNAGRDGRKSCRVPKGRLNSRLFSAVPSGLVWRHVQTRR